MVSLNRFENVRCEECSEPFRKSIYEEDLRCNRCISKKYQDVYYYQVSDRSVLTIILGCLFLAFFGLMSPSEAKAGQPTSIPYSVAYECLCGEACNQGQIGMTAVGEVLRRRGSIKGVYGCRGNMYRKSPEYVKEQVRKAWKESEHSDLTGGATHWENVQMFGQPRWADAMVVTTKIKDHTFMKELE